MRRYKIGALVVIGLALLTAVGWVLLAADEIAVFENTGSPAIVNALTPAVWQAQQSASAMSDRADPALSEAPEIKPAAWMPYWMVIDLLIFLALGVYLRWNLGRES